MLRLADDLQPCQQHQNTKTELGYFIVCDLLSGPLQMAFIENVKGRFPTWADLLTLFLSDAILLIFNSEWPAWDC